MEEAGHERDLPAPEGLLAGVGDPVRPVGDDDGPARVVQPPPPGLPVAPRREVRGLPASGRRRRAAGQAAGRLAAPVLESRAGPGVPPLGRARHRQPGISGPRGAVGLPAANALGLLPPHRDAGPVDGELHARFRRPAVDDLLALEAGRRLAEIQRPALQRARRRVHTGEAVDVPARRLEARQRHRPGDDARHPRRHRPALQAKRPVRREAPLAARPAAEVRPLHLDPAEPARGKDFDDDECRAVGLPQAAHSGAGSVASSRPAEARRRRAAARRGVPERAPAPVQVGRARARVRRQPRQQRTELRRDRPGSASGVPSPATSRLRTWPSSIQHRVSPSACLRTGGGCTAASSSGRPSGQSAASGWRCTRLPSLSSVMTRTPASASCGAPQAGSSGRCTMRRRESVAEENRGRQPGPVDSRLANRSVPCHALPR